MLRRNARIRQEYLLKRQLEEQENATRERKRRVKEAVDQGKPIAPSDRHFEADTRAVRPLEDARSLKFIASHDDEYAYSQGKDPRVLITTSHNPSSRLSQFAKEMKLILPSSERVNRGSYVMKDFVRMAQSNDVTDILVLHEHKGVPDGMILSHLPLGPTVYFSLSDVFLRHDLPTKSPHMSVSPPHLVFENLTSKLGTRITRILQHIFPLPSANSKRVLAFVNKGDRIHFRNLVWEDTRSPGAKHAAAASFTEPNGSGPPDGAVDDTLDDGGKTDAVRAARVEKQKESTVRKILLSEIGPRFVLKPYKIELGTLDMKGLEVEWALRSFINKPREALAEDKEHENGRDGGA